MLKRIKKYIFCSWSMFRSTYFHYNNKLHLATLHTGAWFSCSSSFCSHFHRKPIWRRRRQFQQEGSLWLHNWMTNWHKHAQRSAAPIRPPGAQVGSVRRRQRWTWSRKGCRLEIKAPPTTDLQGDWQLDRLLQRHRLSPHWPAVQVGYVGFFPPASQIGFCQNQQLS